MFKYYQCKHLTGNGVISFNADSAHSCGSRFWLSCADLVI